METSWMLTWQDVSNAGACWKLNLHWIASSTPSYRRRR